MAVSPFILFVFGPPGSGKSTQAESLAREFGAVHFDTGDVLRSILHDPARAQDPKIIEERKKHEGVGQLNDPAWVKDIVLAEASRLRQEGKSIVFSGSPRTLFEAEAELPRFRELYGNRMFLAVLQISEETTMYRNSRRKICEACGRVVPWSLESRGQMLCEACGGALITRPDDAPEIIKRRLQTYHQLTLPVIKFLESQDVKAAVVDGEPPPEVVFQSLKKELQKLI